MTRRLPPITLLDGATGTELDSRGVDISLPLWSARGVLNAPEILGRIHADYLRAGADAITTCTFRTNRRSLARAGLGDRAAALTRRAVEIALAARDEVRPDALVLGSVAPLEDCYRPDLAPPPGEAAEEHAEMITHLLDAGCDMILVETMNGLDESAAASGAARRLAPGRWMISFCCTSAGPPGVLLSGEPLSDLLPGLHDAVAVGVNCVDARAVESQVKLLRMLLPAEVRVAAYANVGVADDEGYWHTSDAVDPERYAEHADAWVAAGATIIGGCCGTTPATIAAIAAHLGRSSQETSTSRQAAISRRSPSSS